MKLVKVLCSAVLLLTGCAGMVARVESIDAAVATGAITGLDPSDKVGVTFRYPNTRIGPYTKVRSAELHVTEGPDEGTAMTVFTGRVAKTKQWQVFGALIQRGDTWATVPVRLPPPAPPDTSPAKEGAAEASGDPPAGS